MKTKIVKSSELNPAKSLHPDDYIGRVRARVTKIGGSERWQVQWQFDGEDTIYTRDNFTMGYTHEIALGMAQFIEEHPAVARRGLTERDKASARPGTL